MHFREAEDLVIEENSKVKLSDFWFTRDEKIVLRKERKKARKKERVRKEKKEVDTSINGFTNGSSS